MTFTTPTTPGERMRDLQALNFHTNCAISERLLISLLFTVIPKSLYKS